MNMVGRLGGFHTMMSFMGSIGTMMKGSGLEEALGNVYGPNTVTHMITGKAVSRALHGHFLIEAALTNKLLIKIWPDNETQENIDCDGEIDIINKLDAIEAVIYIKGFEINLYHLNLLVGQKNYTSSMSVYFNTKHCYVRNLPQQSYGCSIWSMSRH